MPVQTQIQVRRSTAATWTSTNPTLAAGEIGFETDTGKFKIGTGSSTWTALSYAGGGSQATFNTFQYTATSGQTTFSGADANGNTLAYTAGSIQVYLNGALLVNTSDYTASNGTSVVLGTGAVTGDSLTVIALGTFTVSTDIPKSTLTDKGSIVTATAASTPSNLSVGSNDQVLTADSSTATGLKWATPASGSMTSLASGSLTGTSVTLSSINQTYNDLVLRISNAYVLLSTGNIVVRVNNVATADQQNGYLRSDSITPASATTQTGYRSNNMNLPLTANANVVEFIWTNYATAGTVKPATVITSNDSAGAAVGTAVRIGSTAAITSLVILDPGGSTFAGGTYQLFGVK